MLGLPCGMDLPTQALPAPLPENPFVVLHGWLEQARQDAATPNPNAMVLATVDARGAPSARVVLCKQIEVDTGEIFFYSNYESRKGRELAANPRAALVFHWDHRHRQARCEGTVSQISAAKSDAYFASRPWQSQLGAWSSKQSQPVASMAAMRAQVSAAARHFDIPYEGPGSVEPQSIDAEIMRPLHWGGYGLTALAIELWIEGQYRIHERVRWSRNGPEDVWSYERLQP